MKRLLALAATGALLAGTAACTAADPDLWACRDLANHVTAGDPRSGRDKLLYNMLVMEPTMDADLAAKVRDLARASKRSEKAWLTALDMVSYRCLELNAERGWVKK